MKNILKGLVKLADSLDKKSKHNLADEVDLIIRKYSQLDTLTETLKDLKVKDEIPLPEDYADFIEMGNSIMMENQDKEVDSDNILVLTE